MRLKLSVKLLKHQGWSMVVSADSSFSASSRVVVSMMGSIGFRVANTMPRQCGDHVSRKGQECNHRGELVHQHVD